MITDSKALELSQKENDWPGGDSFLLTRIVLGERCVFSRACIYEDSKGKSLISLRNAWCWSSGDFPRRGALGVLKENTEYILVKTIHGLVCFCSPPFMVISSYSYKCGGICPDPSKHAYRLWVTWLLDAKAQERWEEFNEFLLQTLSIHSVLTGDCGDWHHLLRGKGAWELASDSGCQLRGTIQKRSSVGFICF